MFFILEADRSTESSPIIKRKMVAYYYFWQYDKFEQWSIQARIHPERKSIKNFRIITYAATPQRQQALVDMILDITPDKAGSEMFWFTNQTLVDPERPETIFNPIFSIAQENELNKLHSILD